MKPKFEQTKGPRTAPAVRANHTRALGISETIGPASRDCARHATAPNFQESPVVEFQDDAELNEQRKTAYLLLPALTSVLHASVRLRLARCAYQKNRPYSWVHSL